MNFPARAHAYAMGSCVGWRHIVESLGRERRVLTIGAGSLGVGRQRQVGGVRGSVLDVND